MIYAFDAFELDTNVFELRSPAGPLPVEPQVFNVLRYLVEHRDVVVTKETLLDEVWGDRFVSESALTSRIKAARRLLGDDGQAQRFIRTTHGRGYRFVGDVRELSGDDVETASPPRRVHPAPLAEAQSETLVERDHELAVVRAALARATERAGGSIMVISGEAGIGKTALVGAIRRVCSADMQVLAGSCGDLATPRAMGPIHDIAFEIGGRLASALERGDRDAVTDELMNLVRDTPTLLVVEDVHWADDATLDVVRLVARRVQTLPVVLVLTCRSDPADVAPRVRSALGALTGPSVVRIELEPLSPEGVGTLLDDHAAASAVHELTRGNPFFVSELARSPGTTVPATVRDAVLARVVRLPRAAQVLVGRMSVVPGRAERWLVEALSADVAGLLDVAERHGLVSADATHVWFRHELVRRAVESTLTDEERLRAATLVLEQLLTRADKVEPSRLVHHADIAHDTASLLTYAPRAALAAARLGSHSQAVAHYRSALRYRDELDDAATARCLIGLAYSLYLLNEFTAAADTALDAVATAERCDDRSVLGDALSVLTRAVMFARGPGTARRAALRQVELLEGGDDEAGLAEALCDLARTCSNLSTLGPVADPTVEARDAADRALRIAEPLGRNGIASQALTYRGSSRLALGDVGGLDDLQRALELAHGERPELFVRSCVNAAGATARLGRIDDAELHIEHGLTVAAENELHAVEARLTLTRAVMRMTTGAWDDAVDLLRAVIERGDDPGIMRALARALLARIQARRGQAAMARRTLQPALAEAEGSDEAQLVAPVTIAAVELAWLAKEPIPLDRVDSVLHLSVEAGGTAALAELCQYARRAGVEVALPVTAPDPWGLSLAGIHREAAMAWRERGERYEEALELFAAGEVSEAMECLRALGAVATLAAVGGR